MNNLTKWLPVAKESTLILLAIVGLYYGLRSQDDAASATMDKQRALQALVDAAQDSRIERLERIAERQDDLIRALDRLVAKMEGPQKP